MNRILGWKELRPLEEIIVGHHLPMENVRLKKRSLRLNGNLLLHQVPGEGELDGLDSLL